jgi:hypothetical protein
VGWASPSAWPCTSHVRVCVCVCVCASCWVAELGRPLHDMGHSLLASHHVINLQARWWRACGGCWRWVCSTPTSDPTTSCSGGRRRGAVCALPSFLPTLLPSLWSNLLFTNAPYTYTYTHTGARRVKGGWWRSTWAWPSTSGPTRPPRASRAAMYVCMYARMYTWCILAITQASKLARKRPAG